MNSSALLERLEREGGLAKQNTAVISLAPKIAAQIAVRERDRKEAENILLSIRLLLDASIPSR